MVILAEKIVGGLAEVLDMKTVIFKKRAKNNEKKYWPSKMGEQAEGETLLSMSEAQDGVLCWQR